MTTFPLSSNKISIQQSGIDIRAGRHVDIGSHIGNIDADLYQGSAKSGFSSGTEIDMGIKIDFESRDRNRKIRFRFRVFRSRNRDFLQPWSVEQGQQTCEPFFLMPFSLLTSCLSLLCSYEDEKRRSLKLFLQMKVKHFIAIVRRSGHNDQNWTDIRIQDGDLRSILRDRST